MYIQVGKARTLSKYRSNLSPSGQQKVKIGTSRLTSSTKRLLTVYISIRVDLDSYLMSALPPSTIGGKILVAPNQVCFGGNRPVRPPPQNGAPASSTSFHCSPATMRACYQRQLLRTVDLTRCRLPAPSIYMYPSVSQSTCTRLSSPASHRASHNRYSVPYSYL